ncbi:hypothetical protein HAZT_HAZT001611 [Hyalella azteca]|uniref:Period circadian protein n=1 Tax=Hyalella azteca TaxID=294128 RepID=A0A6A0H5I8_HYAAZ|nr:hypothetical protein HAZT_HAZT001611 [Hyalella azteca]
MVLSIRDGTVVRVSTNILDILGFPEDSVVGHSFIDFVYPRDSVHFSSKIVSGMSFFSKNSSARSESLLPPFYCRVRENKVYQASAFDLRGKNSYKPCKITLKFNDALTPAGEEPMAPISPFQLPAPDVLLAEVIPVPSFYRVPDEVINGGNFIIRHSASCNFSEYDPDAIPFLGHLPQDLTGNSIFDCYHPEDLPLLLTIYRERVNKSLYMSGKYGSKDVTDSGSGESASGPSSASGGPRLPSYRHVPLTEEVLSRHNEEMQMLFMERQKKNSVALPGPSRQRERLSGQNLKQTKRFARMPPSQCGLKRPNSGSQSGDHRPHKFPFIEKTSAKLSDPAGLSHVNGALHVDNKLTNSSFNSGSGSRVAQVNGRTDMAVPMNPATGSQEQLQAPYYIPGHPLPAHSCGFQNSSLPSDPSTSLSQEPQLAANPHQYPIAPMIMGPHQAHFMTPQGLALPYHYMGGYPGMYIPHPPFNQTVMYGAGPLMMPNMMSNMMLPHPFVQTSVSNNTRHVSPINLNNSSRQVDNPSHVAQVGPPERVCSASQEQRCPQK